MRQRFLRRVSVCLTACALATLAYATLTAIPLSTTAAITQNFDGLGTTATASLPADFRVDRPATVRSVGNFAGAATATSLAGGASLSATASNGIYNFGSGTTTTGSDRAVGFLSSGTATQSGNLYVQLANNTGGGLASLQVSYSVEKYRNGSNPNGFRIQLFYSADGSTWTSAGVNFRTFFPADASNSGVTPAPSVTVPVSSSLDVSIPAGSSFYLAWNYSVDQTSTTTNAQALAIDDISIRGVGGQTDVAPTLTSTVPANGASNVAATAPIVLTFSESVNADPGAVTVECPTGAQQTFTQTASPSTTFTLTPSVPLPFSTTCTVRVAASAIHDVDGAPDSLAGDVSFAFSTGAPPPAGAGHVVINEIDADTPGSGVDTAEFVELYDGGAGNTPLDGLVVVFYNGNGHVSYASFDLTGYQTNANGYFVLGNPGVPGAQITFDPGSSGFLQNGPDAVALYAGHASDFPNGTPVTTANLLDAVVYDTDDPDDAGLLVLLNDGQPQVNENALGDGPNQSNQRCPNGSGGPRNTSTYLQATPTPGTANTCPAQPPPTNSPVVISQIYTGGGNSSATYHNDYVELFNRSASPIDLTGWSLQYASATGSGWDSNKQPLGGTIGAGQYYLVSLASGGAVGAALPAANMTGGLINMAAAAGKIALVRSFDGLTGSCPKSNPNLMDLVGYGSSADCEEGTAPARAGSNTTALFRLGAGSQDTNDNGADFVIGAPNPRRTAPIVELGPLVLATDPRVNGVNAPRDATIEVTFTEPVDVVDPWFNLSCTTSGVHDDATTATSNAGRDHYITPNANFHAGETCTVTIFKDQISDQDTDDSGPNTDHLRADYVWSFTVASGAAPPYTPDVHLTMGNPSAADVSQPNNYLMVKPEYALSYNRDLGRPNWVSWHLTPEWFGTLSRVDTFRPDPQVPPDWYRVQSFDFQGSGFDRGHMTPNADRDLETSIPINQATYLMSNMVAQTPDNNQGPWANFETYLRSLAGSRDNLATEIYVVSGPAGTGGAGSNGGVTTTIANGHVTVPAFTWKVALVLPYGMDDVSRVTCSTRAIAVIMPNIQGIRTNDPDDWMQYLTTTTQVEELVRQDAGLSQFALFSNLPAPIQYCVKNGINGKNPKNAQTIAFGPLDGHTFGDPDIALTATSSSGLPVMFTVASGPATITGNLVHLTGAGTVTIAASQPGDVNYNAAPDVAQSFTIAKASASVAVTGYTGVYDGSPHGATGTISGVDSENLTPLLSLGQSFTNAPGGTAHWTFDGNANYEPASGDASITITRATPGFSALSSPSIEAGTATTTIGGAVSLGTLIPTGSVNVTFGGVTHSAAIAVDGSFSTSFDTASLAPSTTAYPIAYSYGGDANFSSISGNGALTVTDRVGPSITNVSVTRGTLDVPNHKLFDVVLAYDATDFGADGRTIVSPSVCSVSVTSNEPVDGLGDGDTSPDWIVFDAHRLQLRAERSGLGNGRVYTLTVVCTDGSGNRSTAQTTVRVPK